MTGFNRVLRGLVTRLPRQSLASGSKPSTFGPSSLFVHACLFVGSVGPPSSVTHRDSFFCMLVTWPLDRPYACLSLCSLCTSTRRHTSFSDSRVGLPLRCPPCSSMRCSARGSPLSPARMAPLRFHDASIACLVPSLLLPSSPRCHRQSLRSYVGPCGRPPIL